MLPPFWIISLCSILSIGCKVDLGLAVAQTNLLMGYGKFYRIPSPPWSHSMCLLMKEENNLKWCAEVILAEPGSPTFLLSPNCLLRRNYNVAKWAVWPRTTQRVLMCIKNLLSML